jgi:malic enzyme
VGFGSVMVKAKTVTDSMFLAAARAVADVVRDISDDHDDDDDDDDDLYVQVWALGR